MELSSLYIYPVKSLKGTSLQSVQVTTFGPHMDRRFMLVDEAGRFITQRQISKLALIDVALKDDRLILSLPNSPPLPIKIQTSGPSKTVIVWRDTCQAVDQGDEAAQAVSKFLEKPVRLVFMTETTFRPVDSAYAKDSSNRVSFADGFPFLIISEASLEDLNRRLGMTLSMNRFRPNLVIRGAVPYAEDAWKKIRIGQMAFDLVKPCSRCVTVCVDQQTGEKGEEPLKMLASYRKENQKIFFGQNAIHGSVGRLTVGDPVEILA